MSRQREVLLALRALFEAALPAADVYGFEQETISLRAIGAGGQVIGFPGDPGDPDMDLCPLTYHYTHAVPFELSPGPSGDDDAAIDAMLTALAARIEADRTLGGLVDWIEATAPTRDDTAEGDSVPVRYAAGAIVVSYASTTPLI